MVISFQYALKQEMSKKKETPKISYRFHRLQKYVLEKFPDCASLKGLIFEKKS